MNWKGKNDIRNLVKETAKRYPSQEISKETIDAITDDWHECAKEITYARFEQGLKRCWQYCEFFPKTANIRELCPPPRQTDGERWIRELRDLERRKKAGEKFYTIGDVLEEVARRIKSGTVKPTNSEWFQWAHKFLAQVENRGQ